MKTLDVNETKCLRLLGPIPKVQPVRALGNGSRNNVWPKPGVERPRQEGSEIWKPCRVGRESNGSLWKSFSWILEKWLKFWRLWYKIKWNSKKLSSSEIINHLNEDSLKSLNKHTSGLVFHLTISQTHVLGSFTPHLRPHPTPSPGEILQVSLNYASIIHVAKKLIYYIDRRRPGPIFWH